jgi:hypothetical protein
MYLRMYVSTYTAVYMAVRMSFFKGGFFVDADVSTVVPQDCLGGLDATVSSR